MSSSHLLWVHKSGRMVLIAAETLAILFLYTSRWLLVYLGSTSLILGVESK